MASVLPNMGAAAAFPLQHGSSGPMTIAAITGIASNTTAHATGNAHSGALGSDSAGTTQAERYEKTEKLGEGTYGVVYKARDRYRNKLVALKKVRMDAWEEGVPATALREISVLKEVKHDHIVSLEDVFVSFSGNLYLVFELLTGDLKARLDSNRERGEPMSDVQVRRYLYQMTSAIAACHAHRIVHRDLKPQNVLLDTALPTRACPGNIKIADFGLSRTFALPLRAYTHEVVTLWYRAPEILLGLDAYSAAVDVWSLGCIFGEMSEGHAMFMGDSEVGQLFHIFEKLGTPNASVWPLLPSLPDYCEAFPKFRGLPWERIAPRMDASGRDLLARMLAFDPSARISAAEALCHPYLSALTTGHPLTHALPHAAPTSAVVAPAPGASADAHMMHI